MIAAGAALPLRVMLRFSASADEKRFIAHYVAFYFRYAQVSLVLGVLLVLGDFLVDYIAHPEVQSNYLRLQLCMPMLAAGLGYSFLPAARRHWQPVMAGFITALAFCLFWILLLIDRQGGAGLRTWVGVLNFTFIEFYCFVILGIQFRYALTSGLLILSGFEIAMWTHADIPWRDVAYWSYHVVTLFLLAASIGWWREFLLRKEFAVRTALDEARESAMRMAEAKGEFLSTMSHEIRTPLNGVLGMNELLIDSELQPQQRAWAEGVQSSGRHLLGVINDILDFSKADSGLMQLEAVDFDLGDVLEEAALMFAQPAESKGLELVVNAPWPAGHWQLRGDPFRLRQVIANLISNAIKFTAEGEVVVRASLRSLAHVEAQDPGDAEVSISVEDSGIGIAAEAQARIFEQFAQADGSTTRNHGGTGLGLAICKRLLELMGGSIRVESAPGQGTKFHVSLRLARSLTATPSGSAESCCADLEGLRVLVVDDNHSSRQSLQQQLQALAMQVHVATSGSEALQLIQQSASEPRPFALALIDLHMPRMDGLQLAREVQALPAPPRVLMLGSIFAGSNPTTRQALSLLSSTNKPVRRTELLRGIRTALADNASTQVAHPLPANGANGQLHRQLLGQLHRQLHGHVLLVDDNAMNQRLATAMMEKAGLTVSLASDGEEAVRLVREQAFDLVLMDCQMPVMDGLEATQRIRAWEASREDAHRPLPIIALTANALAGDREACAAAGMSDFLTKPIASARLIEMLMRHLPSSASASATATPPMSFESAIYVTRPAASSVDANPVFDPGVLNELPMVADGSDTGFALSVLAQFMDLSSETMAACMNAAAARDAAALLRHVHTLKSTSAQIGALALSTCAAALEDRLRSEEGRTTSPGQAPGPQLEQLIDNNQLTRLQTEHTQALQAIRMHLATTRAAGLPSTHDCPA